MCGALSATDSGTIYPNINYTSRTEKNEVYFKFLSNCVVIRGIPTGYKDSQFNHVEWRKP